MLNLLRHPFVRAGLVCALLGAAVYGHRFSQAFVAFHSMDAIPWNSPEDECPRSTAGDPALEIIVENIQAKDAIARDLVAERLSLAEAIARFRALDSRRPPHLPIRLPDESGATVEQHYAVYVINWARSVLSERPGGEAACARLDAVLREFLAGSAADQPASDGP